MKLELDPHGAFNPSYTLLEDGLESGSVSFQAIGRGATIAIPGHTWVLRRIRMLPSEMAGAAEDGRVLTIRDSGFKTTVTLPDGQTFRWRSAWSGGRRRWVEPASGGEVMGFVSRGLLSRGLVVELGTALDDETRRLLALTGAYVVQSKRRQQQSSSASATA